MIEINNLYKSFGNNDVLKNINLTVSDHEIHGLVGRSGVGKSTHNKERGTDLVKYENGLVTTF
ncbi:MAG: L-cystine import ATP-binding protein TcyN [Pelotomaculum sp. PtaB.Bin104]|uniref:ATP-binding cassette domain-containing protein n=1 Tax=Pelotomaculum terephthalicicum TaxID=206393 RepID=UPI0009D2C297|nr:ATP-binding cassette domain-containing protein [Pelotomaculum terephthalicicum]OPX85554.1 MAG: L-cystine import ATP-binding protein TcyN [Pelotomaculum sp. PtaB.Bin104]OPY59476.1 MAG: L-cystine import ATP-binding protein TcyN [Pelotomaculum sp. PtaU1.Bin065]